MEKVKKHKKRKKISAGKVAVTIVTTVAATIACVKLPEILVKLSDKWEDGHEK